MKQLLIPILLAGSPLAAELTIKPGPLEASLSIDATFIPSQREVLKISPKQWTDFTIKELVQHGSRVSAGDSLITFEAEDYQKKLRESQEAAKSRKLSFAKTQQQLESLKLSTPQSLEELKITHDRAKEALDDFNQGGRALSEQDARERLDGAKRMLSYQEEELKQLLKMYEEDGVTEETEEIILKRQRASVKSARFSLKKAEKSTTWALEKTIPRKEIDLKRTYQKALQAYEAGKTSLPRTLEEKVLAFAKMKRDHAEAERKLADLETDAQFLTLRAAADGVIYHGEISDHSWKLGNSPKFLKETGKVPSETVFMTLVPSDRSLNLHGTIKQAERLTLPPDAHGKAMVDGLENSNYPIAVSEIAHAPNGEGKYQVTMSVELPAESPIVTGMKAKTKLITFRKKNAISVPNAAITTKNGISTVKIKMADGKSQTREVQIGRVLTNKTEILEGLEAGQVILVPDSPKK